MIASLIIKFNQNCVANKVAVFDAQLLRQLSHFFIVQFLLKFIIFEMYELSTHSSIQSHISDLPHEKPSQIVAHANANISIKSLGTSNF